MATDRGHFHTQHQTTDIRFWWCHGNQWYVTAHDQGFCKWHVTTPASSSIYMIELAHHQCLIFSDNVFTVLYNSTDMLWFDQNYFRQMEISFEDTGQLLSHCSRPHKFFYVFPDASRPPSSHSHCSQSQQEYCQALLKTPAVMELHSECLGIALMQQSDVEAAVTSAQVEWRYP